MRNAMSKPKNKIEKLIEAFCPEGVEITDLGEVAVEQTEKGRGPKRGMPAGAERDPGGSAGRSSRTVKDEKNRHGKPPGRR